MPLYLSQNASQSLKIPVHLSKCLFISKIASVYLKMFANISKCLLISQNACASLKMPPSFLLKRRPHIEQIVCLIDLMFIKLAI